MQLQMTVLLPEHLNLISLPGTDSRWQGPHPRLPITRQFVANRKEFHAWCRVDAGHEFIVTLFDALGADCDRVIFENV